MKQEKSERQKLIESSSEFLERMRKECGVLPDSTEFIRAMRNGEDK